MKTVPALVVFLFLTVTVFSQSEALPAATREAAEKIKNGDYESILELGKSEDKDVIPFLKTLLGKGALVGDKARTALAKLGEAEYLDQILSEIDAEDPGVQDEAMKKLAYVGGRDAFRKFFQLLDDTAPRENPQCKINLENFKKEHPEGGNCAFCCCVIYFPKSTTAMMYLRTMVENPPTKNFYGTRKDIPLWKEWFEKNKRLIE